ncbi:MAG: hypothetical protein ABIQ15_14925 [Nocardioides sp.]
MNAIIIAMLLIVVVAAAVVVYVAFPHREKDVPGAPWLGEAMSKAVDALPTVADGAAESGRVGVDELAQGRDADQDVAAHR